MRYPTAELGTVAESIAADPWNLTPHRKNPFSYSSCNLSFDLKRVALRASASVVGILSHLGETKISRGSGFVIESSAVDGKFVSVILTSASILRPEAHTDAVVNGIKMSVILSNEITCKGDVLAHNFHYNIGVIKIETDVPIATARLRHVNDSISIDPNMLDEKPSEFHLKSDKFNLVPGDTVVALGRYHVERNRLMVVAGEFSVNLTGLDCKELFRAEFEISRHGIGGPLINCHGEVIGINFYRASFTPFLPINIVSMWWEQFKKNGHCVLPWLGMELSNLYLWEAAYLECVIQRFPKVFEGVVVDLVCCPSSFTKISTRLNLESHAHSTALLPRDVIVECDGKFVRGVLEFLELIWDKVGQPVHLAVLRPSDGSRLTVTVMVGNVGPDKFNRWPLPEQNKGRLGRLRKTICK